MGIGALWRLLVVVAVALVGSTFSAAADVPGHVPALDKRCGAGKQYSRKIAHCAQAKCPAGAGRMYNLGCNCGEAWGKPTRTCVKDGLAYACVKKGQPCPGESRCPRGTVKSGTKCEAAFPGQLRCQVRDLFDKPLGGIRVRGGTAQTTTDPSWKHRFDQTADSRGFVYLPVGDRAAPFVRTLIRTQGYSPSRTSISRGNRAKRCVLRVFNAADVERFLRDEYSRLLGNACVPKSEIARLARVAIDFSSADGPIYDPNSRTLKIGRLGTDWESMSPELAHEFAHAISHVIIDPGKNVGGPHDNWKPARVTDAGTPEELAFEESLGDFVGMMLHRARNQAYQRDLEDGQSYKPALRRFGTRAGSKMDGVITSFLYQYYRPIIEGGRNGPERALADYLRVIRGARARLGRPVRTIGEFVREAKLGRSGIGVANRCRIDRRRLPNVDALSRTFGVHW